MPDWTKSMQQTYEFYEVDPTTWRNSKLVDDITSCSISRDDSSETLGSATLDCTSVRDEGYIRVVLKTVQNGITERTVLGTYLAITPKISYNGLYKSISMDCYTPLIELKEKLPPLGYTIFKNTNTMDAAYDIANEYCRAPVSKTTATHTLISDFVADTDDTWVTCLSSLISNASYQLDLEPDGTILFKPIQNMAGMSPVWTFNDDNSSILLPDVEDERDLYDVPNVVEVLYSSDTSYLYSKVTNIDPASATSVPSRGREIHCRDTSPSWTGTPTKAMLDDYAKSELASKSTIEHTVTFTHGYAPVRVGDCVLLNYERAGLKNVKARITSQSISCETGCQIEETAYYTENLWTDNMKFEII